MALLATCFHAGILLGLFLYSLTLKIEEICSSETSVDFQWTTQHYTPDDSTLLFYVKKEVFKCEIILLFSCSIAHTIHEIVTEQATILVNGKLKEYQIKVERAAFSSVMTNKVTT
jgi:hypothetical protein